MFIEVVGRINEQGKLEFDLPPDLPPGEVRIFIERIDAQAEAEDEARWDASFARPESQRLLEQWADEALQEDDTGLTTELDLDELLGDDR